MSLEAHDAGNSSTSRASRSARRASYQARHHLDAEAFGVAVQAARREEDGLAARATGGWKGSASAPASRG
jgi:hypothetical protein